MQTASEQTPPEGENRNRRLLRSTLAVSIPTLLSRVLGYFRDVLSAYFMGTDSRMDAYTIAFLIPNLLRRLTAEGAMTAAFVPVFTQYKQQNKKEELWRFANIFFFDLTFLMAVFTTLGILFAPVLVKGIAWGFGKEQGELTVFLTRLMFPYIFLVSLAALVMAILNSFHKFFVPAFTPVLFNLAIIVVAVIFAPHAKEPAVVFAAGILIGGTLQLAFQIPFAWRRGMRFRPMMSFTHPAVRKVGRLMVPGIFGVGIYQINMALSRSLASSLETGSASSLYYASRIQELTLGLFSVALSIAILPTLSEMAGRKDLDGIKKSVIFSMKMILFITLPAMVGLIILHRPIIRVLYEYGKFDIESTMMTSTCLLFFALSLPFISGVKILAPAFYSLKDTKTPVIVAFFVTFIYIPLALVLMKPLNVGGIALALSISSVFNFFVLFILLERKIGKIKKADLLKSTLKSLLISGLMGAGLFILAVRLDMLSKNRIFQFGGLAVIILSGILFYLLANLLVNREDFRNLKRMLSKNPSSRKGEE